MTGGSRNNFLGWKEEKGRFGMLAFHMPHLRSGETSEGATAENGITDAANVLVSTDFFKKLSTVSCKALLSMEGPTLGQHLIQVPSNGFGIGNPGGLFTLFQQGLQQGLSFSIRLMRLVVTFVDPKTCFLGPCRVQPPLLCEARLRPQTEELATQAHCLLMSQRRFGGAGAAASKVLAEPAYSEDARCKLRVWQLGTQPQLRQRPVATYRPTDWFWSVPQLWAQETAQVS